MADLGDMHIERYQHRSRRQHQGIRTETRRREWYEVAQLLQFLRGHGVCWAARVETTAAADLAARYGQHLQDQQGLATATIERYRTVAGLFLHERFGNGAVDLRSACRRCDRARAMLPRSNIRFGSFASFPPSPHVRFAPNRATRRTSGLWPRRRRADRRKSTLCGKAFGMARDPCRNGRGVT